jgi:DNA-directed RNA polymerase subunit RPC12/RpoP
MVKTTCPACGRVFQPKPVALRPVVCPDCAVNLATEGTRASELTDAHTQHNSCQRCSKPFESDTLYERWDGNDYCMDCLADADLLEYGSADRTLEERIEFGVLYSLARALLSAVVLTTVLAVFVVVLASLAVGAFALAAAMGGNGQVIWQIGVLRHLDVFFAFAWLFFATAAFPFLVIRALIHRRRSIRVVQGQFIYETPFGRTAAPLLSCAWHVGRMAPATGNVFSLSPVIDVLVSDRQRVLCGFTVSKRELWRRFFTLVGVPREPPARRWIIPSLLSMVPGGVVGLLFGLVAASITGIPQWIVAAPLLGALDGALCGVGYAYWARASRARARRTFHPARVAAVSAFLGSNVGALAGAEALVACGIGNGCLGWIMAMDVVRRAPISEDSSTERD